MLGMGAIDAITERRTALASLEPGLDDIPDKRRFIRSLRQLALVKVSGDGADACQVGLGWCEYCELR
jgi:hypothetical protein